MNIFKIVVGVIIALVVLVGAPKMWENLDSSEIMVIQSPISGEITVHTEPGIKYQGFGTVTKYPRQESVTFDKTPELDTSISIQFNDGGTASILGSVNWEMPLNHDEIIKVHRQFKTAEGIRKAAVEKMLDTATYMSGQLMNSMESVSERKSELVNFINDQAVRGIYATRVRDARKKDEATGEERDIKISEVVIGEDGKPVRQQSSLLQEFNIRLQPLSIKKIVYEGKVQEQINNRQKATNDVLVAIANATRAKQDAVTTEAQGQANAAQAKWDQETLKAKAVTLAEQERDVAKLAKEKAEFYKQEQILIGQGDAERKRATMQADGALEQKLKAYVEVQQHWAEAFANSKNPLVPQIQMGANGNSNATTTAQSLIEMLSAKTAKDLALDISNK